MVWRPDDPQGNEAGKVKWDIVPYTRGKGLDLGCGPAKAFPHFVGVDNCIDRSLFGIDMSPDIEVETCERLDGVADDESLDFIFSSHLLEHIANYRAALRNWWAKIKPGGHLVLYLPHKDHYPNVGEPGANPDHKHDFEPCDIKDVMRDLGGWNLVVNETRAEGTEYSFLQVWQKRADGEQKNVYLTQKKPKKTACVVRYGGFGDMLQAANILPGLKRQGFHVTVMTTPRGHSVLEHDPNVDAFYLQDDNQVPNRELVDFWEHMAKKFDRFVNLSESIEGTLLAMPGRANHLWPHEIRHRHMNRNYLEWTAELAGVPMKPDAVFWPTAEEVAAAAERLTPERFCIVFTLSGSSVHKFYPHQDAVIARCLMTFPDVQFYLTGDEACKILEYGWEDEPRVTCLSGEIGIRDTLALAKFADMIVGPETGVLNAVAFENMPKVCLLSHSSAENLTKHWQNTVALAPEGVPCHPCHQLHYGRRYCHEEPQSGAAICQAAIDPARVVEAIEAAYLQWETARCT